MRIGSGGGQVAAVTIADQPLSRSIRIRPLSHDDQSSVLTTGSGGAKVLAIARAVSALPEDCMRAQIVISSLPLHGKCAGP
jgi:hypothetical protein